MEGPEQPAVGPSLALGRGRSLHKQSGAPRNTWGACRSLCVPHGRIHGHQAGAGPRASPPCVRRSHFPPRPSPWESYADTGGSANLSESALSPLRSARSGGWGSSGRWGSRTPVRSGPLVLSVHRHQAPCRPCSVAGRKYRVWMSSREHVSGVDVWFDSQK